MSPITFGILREREAQAVAVSEAEVARSGALGLAQHQLVVEPGGAVALAALLAGKVEPRDGTVVDPVRRECRSRRCTRGSSARA